MAEPEFALEIQVRPGWEPYVDEGRLRAAVAAALRHTPPERAVELTLVITGDEEIAELNRTYRHTDGPTDVLSFGMGPDAYAPREGALYLGDIVISYPRCAEQAQEYGHSAQRELALLVIHGVLHLLGYDHASEEEEREMWALQERALAEAASDVAC